MVSDYLRYIPSMKALGPSGFRFFTLHTKYEGSRPSGFRFFMVYVNHVTLWAVSFLAQGV